MRLIIGSLVALVLSCGQNTLAAGSYSETDSQAAPGSTAAASEQYPRVCALENTLLGQSFPGQDLATRLARMETAVFGKASESPDLGDRTDKLEDYAEQKFHKKLFQPDPSYEAAGPEDDQGPPIQSDYPRIVALEKAILGQTFPGDPPADRLSRMEAQAFGTASSSPDLSDRTEKLQKYAEKKLHKNVTPPDAQGRTQASASGSQLPRQLLSILGSAILGVPGLGQVGSPAPQETPPEDQSNRPREDDAALRSATPPPPTARMITKVGWCEHQVFGRTYPELHLPNRLEQLNAELNFRPGKTGLQLMDEVAGLMQAVQAKFPSAKTIGAAPEPAAQQ